MARANLAIRASREEAVSGLAALQARAFDASMFISYMQARVEKNEKMETFLFQRFRPRDEGGSRSLAPAGSVGQRIRAAFTAAHA
jgi:hypothetical protein